MSVMRRLALVSLLGLCLLLPACASGKTAAYKHVAATTVDALLTLRSGNNRDVAEYEPFFADAAMAQALVDSSPASTGTPVVPGWDAPFVSKLTSDTAEVVVVWTGLSGDFSSWPPATSFVMKSVESHWIIVDAVDLTGPIPRPLRDAVIERF